ncbi:MAG TPA: acetylornithine transaminase [Candidatus Dormibacteraeota bacterium]|nr:acetylornithine transaminase [Candidatus Dormibacteraeota bacterium]
MAQTRTDIAELEHQYLMGTFKRLPITLVEGRGVTVRDSEGRLYLDMVAGIAVNALGHAHPAVADALADQARRLVHTSNLYYSEPQVELARRLVELSFPSRVFFSNSGAEANETAIKLARKWGKVRRDGAHEIITTDGSFHGRTLATVTAGGKDSYSAPFAPLPPGFVHVPYGDAAAVESATTDATVAVMLEPIMGEIGVIVPPDGYLEAVRAWCDERDLLLILDEVQTGIGRTGRWFAHQHNGVVPDVMTLAKALGGGVPIGACLAGPRADVFEPGDHGSTFGGNPLACAAGVAVLRTIEEQGLVGHAAEMGELLRDYLRGLEGVKTVRGRGLMQAVVFEQPVAKEFQSRCLAEGVIVNAVDEETVRLVPPLVISADEIERAVAAMKRAKTPAGSVEY